MPPWPHHLVSQVGVYWRANSTGEYLIAILAGTDYMADLHEPAEHYEICLSTCGLFRFTLIEDKAAMVVWRMKLWRCLLLLL